MAKHRYKSDVWEKGGVQKWPNFCHFQMRSRCWRSVLMTPSATSSTSRPTERSPPRSCWTESQCPSTPSRSVLGNHSVFLFGFQLIKNISDLKTCSVIILKIEKRPYYLPRIALDNFVVMMQLAGWLGWMDFYKFRLICLVVLEVINVPFYCFVHASGSVYSAMDARSYVLLCCQS